MPEFILILACAALSCLSPEPVDHDRDGLPDDIEQALLERFVPAFRVSAGECDVLPAEFLPGSREPRVLSRNGTIYGQVFPGASAGHIEIHYYHLWSRDCGRRGHALDVEHVSALISADQATEWKALYWYAAAHHNTMCDAGHGARARAIGAEHRGPSVWISKGKHASYLSEEACGRGCGADRCLQSTRMEPAKLINVGELGAPLNGAVWVESQRWSLAPKMSSSFDEGVLARLNESESGVVQINEANPPLRAVAVAGGAALSGIATGGRHAEAALSTADAKAENALVRARRAAGNWLRRRFTSTQPSPFAPAPPSVVSPQC